MLNEKFVRFGAGVGTYLSPWAIIALLLVALLIFLLPRKYVSLPLLSGCFLIPLTQRLVIGGFHLMGFRMVVLLGWLRVAGELFGNRSRKLRFNSVDACMILSTAFAVVTFTALYGTLGALINRIGLVYNVIGGYFLLRVLYRDQDDVRRAIKALALICAIISVEMIWEQTARVNLFGAVDGLARVRNGHVRAQGPFGHAILAGTFGAVAVPLFLGLWWQDNKSRRIASLGFISATIITFTAVSSTAVMAYIAGIAGLLMWRFHRYLRLLCWGTMSMLICLHICMKAPVWALIARIDLVGGSSGYHRFMLIDQTINHFGQWWLLGASSTNQWGYDLWDTSNMFVDAAVTGGIATLLAFLAVIIFGFRKLGVARRRPEHDPHASKMVWALGVALFANIIAFFGVTYFDQCIIAWYSLLAMICVSTSVANADREIQASKP